MRYMLMHKHDQHTEAGERPSQKLLAEMGAFIGEHAQRGTFLGGEGLGASATRTRLTFKNGRCTVKHGPYGGSDNELPAEALLLTVGSRDEAIGWGERYLKIVGEGELEIGAVTEPWDLGFGAKPDSAPLRMLMLPKADAATESGDRTSKQKADLTRLKTEMKKAGVLTSSETMHPSSKSRRLAFTDNKLRVIDGPFSESKELIGGFAILKLGSTEEVIRECTRYAAILGGTLEIDVRPLYESDEAA